MEGVCAAFMDEFPDTLRKGLRPTYLRAGFCISCFLLGLPQVCEVSRLQNHVVETKLKMRPKRTYVNHSLILLNKNTNVETNFQSTKYVQVRFEIHVGLMWKKLCKFIICFNSHWRRPSATRLTLSNVLN